MCLQMMEGTFISYQILHICLRLYEIVSVIQREDSGYKPIVVSLCIVFSWLNAKIFIALTVVTLVTSL